MMGNYKPLSYIYYFLADELEQITYKLASDGITMADLGSCGCCGVRFLKRTELDNALAEYENRKEQCADEEPVEELVRPIERTIIPTEENLNEQQEEKTSIVMDVPKNEYVKRLLFNPYYGKPLYWGWKSWTKRIHVNYGFY